MANKEEEKDSLSKEIIMPTKYYNALRTQVYGSRSYMGLLWLGEILINIRLN